MNQGSRLERWIGRYQSAALMVVNTFVCLLLLNLALLLFFSIKDRFHASDPVTEKYGSQSVLESYPHRGAEEVNALLDETWSRRFEFEPYTMFVEAPYSGTYVNVDPSGFRLVENQGPWPIDPRNQNVFVFGGSTTFGYGVGDDETVPSNLQRILRRSLEDGVMVYNFGRGHYTSSHERILFQQLLTAGQIPDVAIFIDGLNDFYYWDEPFYTRRLRRVLQNPGSRATELLADVPMVRAAMGIATLIAGRDIEPEAPAYDDPEILERVIDRYRSNIRMIQAVSQSYGIDSVFVLQPVPTYRNDHSSHPFLDWRGFERHTYSRHGYPLVEALAAEGEMGTRFFSCADIQEGFDGPLYVDVVHYSAQFSRSVAECIARRAPLFRDSVAHIESYPSVEGR